MGEMADYYLDHEDYFDGRDEERPIQCKYCGEHPLLWEETDKGWRLFDEMGDMHDCLRPQAASEFGIVKENQ